MKTITRLEGENIFLAVSLIVVLIISIFLVMALIYGGGENTIMSLKKENIELKEQIGKDVWRLEVVCIKHDNKGWMNTTIITTHIHSFKYYQTYSDFKEMVEGYEECEVRE